MNDHRHRVWLTSPPEPYACIWFAKRPMHVLRGRKWHQRLRDDFDKWKYVSHPSFIFTPHQRRVLAQLWDKHEGKKQIWHRPWRHPSGPSVEAAPRPVCPDCDAVYSHVRLTNYEENESGALISAVLLCDPGVAGMHADENRVGETEPARSAGRIQVGSRAMGEFYGHFTMADGSHRPMTEEQGMALLRESEEYQRKRAEQMPDEQSAIRAMFDAHDRLRELGWRDAVYCPKDGTEFLVIEPGSTGQHPCHYQGEWPTGSWTDGDCGMRPVLFKLYPKDEAARQEKMRIAAAKFAAKQTTK
jgi:hypothetical protein